MNMLLQEFVSGEGLITELAHMFLGKKFAEICSQSQAHKQTKLLLFKFVLCLDLVLNVRSLSSIKTTIDD